MASMLVSDRGALLTAYVAEVVLVAVEKTFLLEEIAEHEAVQHQ